MEHKKAIDHVIQLMQRDLPDVLRYHSLGHTLGVIRSCEYLGKKHPLTDEESALLYTSAAYHDSGFIKAYKDHEAIGCEIVEEMLPAFNYTPEQIVLVQNMIRATKIPQTPTTLLEKILCDADLDYLGGGQYDEISENLFEELGLIGIEMNEIEKLDMQIRFLEGHHYWTDFAIKVLAPKKQKILDKLLIQRKSISES